jgi:hypothetical protein
MHEVVQDTEIEVHPDFVQNRLKTGVERLAILPDDEGRSDSTKALRRIRRDPRNKVMRLCAHLRFLRGPAAYALGKTAAGSSWSG